MALGDMGMDMGMSGEDEPDAPPLDDLTAAAQEAFPAEEWTPERISALEELIYLCAEKGKAGGYDESPGKPKKGDVDLVLAFGGGPKKKS